MIRNLITLTIMLCAAFAGTAADARSLELTFSYCGKPAKAIPINTGEIGMGIYISAEKTTEYAGNYITAIEVANPVDIALSKQGGPFVNSIREATVFVGKSLDKKPEYSCKAELGSEGFAWTSVPLEKPYLIEGGKELCIGVMYENVGATDAAVITDGTYAVNMDSSSVWSLWSGSNNASGQPILQDYYSWRYFGNMAGNVCVRAIISGDALPSDSVSLDDASAPISVAPGDEWPLTVGFTNRGANAVTSLEVTLEIEGMGPQTCTVATQPVEFQQSGSVQARFRCDRVGNAIPWKAYISKINGDAPNKLASGSDTGWLLCLDGGFERTVVAEELTSTHCQWCPIGYVGMETMRKRFMASGRFAGITVHTDYASPDPLDICGEGKCYSGFYALVPHSLPSAWFHRIYDRKVEPSADNLIAAFRELSEAPAVAAIDASVTNSGDIPVLDVSVRFALDEDNADYGVAYTILEDNVGPYMQSNACSGQPSRPEYGGFENQPKVVPLYYNDVAREGSVYAPIASSIPAVVREGETYAYSAPLDISALSNAELHYAVVAMVVNRKTGYIENARRVLSPEYAASVDGVRDDSSAPTAFGLQGYISLMETADIYASDGRLVAARATGEIRLPAGIYLVRTAKGAEKVLVR